MEKTSGIDELNNVERQCKQSVMKNIAQFVHDIVSIRKIGQFNPTHALLKTVE